jgi:hypothetical protein
VLAYLRKDSAGGDSVSIALNMSSQPQTIKFQLSDFGIEADEARVLLASPAQSGAEVKLDQLTLGPFGVFIGTAK